MNPRTEAADTRVSPKREPRLPPGQVVTERWPVLHHGSVPKVDLARWDLRVHGLVERPLAWTWQEFRTLPRVQVRCDIHCVTRWSRFDNLWEGVSVRELLRRAGVKPAARFAVIHAGQLVASTTPAEARAALRGSIYEGSVTDAELPALREAQQVTQSILVEGKRRVRIRSIGNRVPPGFEPSAPTLEDVYMVLVQTARDRDGAVQEVPALAASPEARR